MQELTSRNIGCCRWKASTPQLQRWLHAEALAGSDTQKAWQHIKWVAPREEEGEVPGEGAGFGYHPRYVLLVDHGRGTCVKARMTAGYQRNPWEQLS